jgi:toluene monooxygenase system protein D
MSGARDPVGPVLAAGGVAEAVIAALRRRNRGLVVENRGAYLRAVAPGRCVLRRADVEEALGRRFVLPRELETVMPSFHGRLAFTAEGAEWALDRP